jgi:PKHD-type hydroxylase
MNNRYNYWFFEKALSIKLCNKIIELGKKTHKQKGQININKSNIKDLTTRNCKVAFLNKTWIYKTIHPYIHTANKNAGWNYDWDFTEECQFTEYSKGNFYDWHCDSWPDQYSNTDDKNKLNKTRKLSVTVSLSDPKKYKGGELEFDLRNNRSGKPNLINCSEIMPKGSIVVFPSHVWHRVKPVTKGIRHSLVAWNLGKLFR